MAISLDNLKNLGKAAVQRTTAERLLKDNVLLGYNPALTEEEAAQRNEFTQLKNQAEVDSMNRAREEEYVRKLLNQATASQESALASREETTKIGPTSDPSALRIAGDAAVGLTKGATGLVGGLVQSGLGLTSLAGLTGWDAYRAVADFNEGVQGGLDSLRSDRALMSKAIKEKKMGSIRQNMEARVRAGELTEVEAQYELFKESLANTDAYEFLDLVSSGLGSVGPLGLVGKAANKGAQKLIGVAADSAAAKAASHGAVYATGFTSALGSTNDMVVAEINGLKKEQLKGTPIYQLALEQTYGNEDLALEFTKKELVDQAFRDPANFGQAAVSGVADNLAITPLKGVVGKGMHGLVGRTGLEATEGATQMVVQTGLANEAAIKGGDAARYKYKGAGEGAASGLVMGVGAGAAGGSVSTVASGVGAIAGAAKGKVDNVLDKRKQGHEADYVATTDQRNETIRKMKEADPVEGAKVEAVARKIDQALSHDGSVVENSSLSAELKQALKDQNIATSSELIEKMTAVAESGQVGTQDIVEMARIINQVNNQKQTASKEALEASTGLNKQGRHLLKKGISGLSAESQVALERLGNVLTDVMKDFKANNTSEESSAKTLGDAAAILSLNNVAGIEILAQAAKNGELTKAIDSLSEIIQNLELDENGQPVTTGNTEIDGLNQRRFNYVQNNKLSKENIEQLRAFSNLVNNPIAAKFFDGIKNLTSKIDNVQYAMLYGENGSFSKGESGKDYMVQILDSINRGDRQATADLLGRLSRFVEGQSNKLNALNQAKRTGKAQTYNSYHPVTGEVVEHQISYGTKVKTGKKWKNDKGKVIEATKTVGGDKLLAAVTEGYNALTGLQKAMEGAIADSLDGLLPPLGNFTINLGENGSAEFVVERKSGGYRARGNPSQVNLTFEFSDKEPNSLVIKDTSTGEVKFEGNINERVTLDGQVITDVVRAIYTKAKSIAVTNTTEAAANTVNVGGVSMVATPTEGIPFNGTKGEESKSGIILGNNEAIFFPDSSNNESGSIYWADGSFSNIHNGKVSTSFPSSSGETQAIKDNGLTATQQYGVEVLGWNLEAIKKISDNNAQEQAAVSAANLLAGANDIFQGGSGTHNLGITVKAGNTSYLVGSLNGKYTFTPSGDNPTNKVFSLSRDTTTADGFKLTLVEDVVGTNTRRVVEEPSKKDKAAMAHLQKVVDKARNNKVPTRTQVLLSKTSVAILDDSGTTRNFSLAPVEGSNIISAGAGLGGLPVFYMTEGGVVYEDALYLPTGKSSKSNTGIVQFSDGTLAHIDSKNRLTALTEAASFSPEILRAIHDLGVNKFGWDAKEVFGKPMDAKSPEFKQGQDALANILSSNPEQIVEASLGLSEDGIPVLTTTITNNKGVSPKQVQVYFSKGGQLYVKVTNPEAKKSPIRTADLTYTDLETGNTSNLFNAAKSLLKPLNRMVSQVGTSLGRNTRDSQGNSVVSNTAGILKLRPFQSESQIAEGNADVQQIPAASNSGNAQNKILADAAAARDKDKVPEVPVVENTGEKVEETNDSKKMDPLSQKKVQGLRQKSQSVMKLPKLQQIKQVLNQLRESMLPSTVSLEKRTGVPAAIHKKDQEKSNLATRFLGEGSEGSSTRLYKESWDEAHPELVGKPFVSDDIVFISVNGQPETRARDSIRDIIPALVQAMEVGATLIQDNIADRSRDYNIGERLLGKLLDQISEKFGYVEVEESGIWVKKDKFTVQEEVNLSEPIQIELETQVTNTTPWEATVPTSLEAREAMKAAYPGIAPESQLLRNNKLNKNSIAAKSLGEIMQKLTEVAKATIEASEGTAKLFKALTTGDKTNVFKGVTGGLNELVNYIVRSDDFKSYYKAMVPKDPEAAISGSKYKILQFGQSNPEGFTLDQKVLTLTGLAVVDMFMNLESITTRPLKDTDGNPISPINHLINILASGENQREAVSTYLLEEYNLSDLTNAMLPNEIESVLAQSLRRFLGIDVNRSSTPYAADGPIAALALNVVSVLEKAGILDKDMLTYHSGNTKRDVKVLSLSNPMKALMDSLRSQGVDRGVISKAILGEKTNGLLFEPTEKVSNTATRSSLALSDDQKAAITITQQKPRFLDLNTSLIFTSLGRENMFNFLGAGKADEVVYGPHKETVAGKEITFNGAWSTVLDIIEEANIESQKQGKSIDDVEAFYKFVMSKVSRLSPDGKYNAVADTLVREVVLPTKGEINLDKDLQYTKLAIAQGLDISIEKGLVIDNVGTKEEGIRGGKLGELLNNLEPSLKLIEQSSERTLTASEMDTLISNLKDNDVPLKPRTLKVLGEVVRIEKALAEGKKKILSHLYIEADGISNGYVMTGLLIGAEPSREFLGTLFRGGITFGANGISYNQIASQQGYLDNYKSIGNYATESVNDLVKTVTNSGFSKEGNSLIKTTFDLFERIAGTVSVEGENFVIERGTVKYPIVKINYGAGSTAVARSLVKEFTVVFSEMVDGAYRDEAETNMTFAEALGARILGHPREGTSTANLEAYRDVMGKISEVTTSTLSLDSEGEVKLFTAEYKNGANLDKKASTMLNEFAFNNFTTNVVTTIANPILEGVNKHNPTLYKSMQNFAGVTSTMSSVLVSLFQEVINRKLKAKGRDPSKKATGSRTKEYLTFDELDQILTADLKQFNPVISLNGQKFPLFKIRKQFLAEGKLDNSATSFYDKNYEEFKGSGPSRIGAINLGVGGLANFAISQGDGRTVINLVLNPELATQLTTGVELIFDGIHYHVNDIKAGAQLTNKAVADVIGKNPFPHLVYQLAQGFEKAVNLNMNELSEDVINTLFENLYRTEAAREKALSDNVPKTGAIRTKLSEVYQDNLSELLNRAIEQEAMNKILPEIATSFDQMASIGEPYNHEGISFSSEEALLEYMQKRLEEEVALIKPRVAKLLDTSVDKNLEGSESLLKGLEELGSVDDTTQAITVAYNDLWKLGDHFENRDLRKLFKRTIRSFSGNRQREAVVIGSESQVIEKLSNDIVKLYKNQGKSISVGEARTIARDNLADSSGAYIPNKGIDKVYLTVARQDTLAHELLHKAMYSAVREYHNGTMNKESPAYLGMKNIVALYGEFTKEMNNLVQGVNGEKNYRFRELTPSMRTFLDQLNQINRDYANDPAERNTRIISEFISWGLTDHDLRGFLKDISTAELKSSGKLLMIAKAIKDFVLEFIFGKGGMSKAKQRNLLESLEFNTGIVSFGGKKIKSRTTGELAPSLKQLRPKSQEKIYTTLDRVKSNMEKMQTPLVTRAHELIGEPLASRDWQEQVNQVERTVDNTASYLVSVGALNTQQYQAYKDIVSFLALGKDTNSLALQEMQRVFEAFLESMVYEDLLPENYTSNDHFYAHKMYDALMDGGTNENTPNGQSYKLFNFVALMLVNPDLAQKVDKIDVSKTQLARTNKKLSEMSLGEVANSALEQVATAYLKKTDKDSVLSAKLESLFAQAATVPSTGLSKGLERLSEFSRTNLDLVDDYVSSSIQQLFERGSKVKGLGGLTYLSESLLSDDAADALADTSARSVSEWKLPQPLKEFLWEFTGRTAKNAGVYDLFKQVRNLIQRRRQQFLDNYPEILKKSLPEATEKMWENFTTSMAQIDVGSLSFDEWKSSVLDSGDRARLIDYYYKKLGHYTKDNIQRVEELAEFIRDNNLVPNGNNNAHNIARAQNHNPFANLKLRQKYANEVKYIDKLATLIAMDKMNQSELASLIKKNEKGMAIVHGNLASKYKDEFNELVTRDYFGDSKAIGYIKGNLVKTSQGNEHFVYVKPSQVTSMEERGYVHLGKVADVEVMFSANPNRAPFNQGIAQNAVIHIGNMQKNNPAFLGQDFLLKLGDSADKAIPIPKQMLESLNRESDLSKLLGVNLARKEEEAIGSEINKRLVDELYAMWKKDPIKNKGTYVNVLDTKYLANNPVLKDAVSILGRDIKDYANNKFGEGTLWIRKDLLNQVVGYRGASVADFWKGTNTLAPEVNQAIKESLEAIMGKNAMGMLMKAQAVLENLVADAKSIIVAKSFVVSAVNALSNIYHMMAIGVPIHDFKKIPQKVLEIEQYLKNNIKEIEIETKIKSSQRTEEISRLETELEAIRDSYRNLSIWPLIQRGEFSTITKDQITREHLLLTQGKFSSYMNKQLDKLPAKGRNITKNLLITKDSPVYEGLQKFVDYGDFVSKAIVYDHLIQTKRFTQEKALGEITEEFVNYDLLPGRFRGTMEKLGLLWFYNFKIRSTKIALRNLRRNPARALLTQGMPQVDAFGSLGMPLTDNLFYKLADGSLGYSVGPQMGIHSPMMHPTVSLGSNLFF